MQHKSGAALIWRDMEEVGKTLSYSPGEYARSVTSLGVPSSREPARETPFTILQGFVGFVR